MFRECLYSTTSPPFSLHLNPNNIYVTSVFLYARKIMFTRHFLIREDLFALCSFFLASITHNSFPLYFDK